MTGRMWVVVGAISASVVVCTCVVCMALVALYPMPQSYYATSTARAWATRSATWTAAPHPREPTPPVCTRLYGDGHCAAYCNNRLTFNLQHGGDVTFFWTQSTPASFVMFLYEADGDRMWELEPGTTGHWTGHARATLSPGDYRLEICCNAGTDYDVTITECR